jgi:hypothetical protein
LKKKLLKTTISILLAILILLPVCANATTMDFYTDGWITDGNNFETVNVWNDANVTMTGGYTLYCNLYNSSAFNFYDGDIGLFSTYQSAIVNVFADDDSGFDIYNQSQIHLFNGGNGSSAFIYDDAELHIYGYNLKYIVGGPDQVVGFWPDYQSFSILIRNSPRGALRDNVFLHEIPEPSTLSLLGLLTLFIRRKRGERVT